MLRQFFGCRGLKVWKCSCLANLRGPDLLNFQMAHLYALIYCICRKKKKIRRKKAKLQQQMNLKMILPGDKIEYSEDFEMFGLNKIKNKKVGVLL